MHGVRRVRDSQEAESARKQRERAKLDEFITLSTDILKRKQNNDWTLDTYRLTTRLLQVNPEFYTVWNYRRLIMLNGLFISSSPEDIHKIITDDLYMTMRMLKEHPKIYWIWNHRRWCLERIPYGPGDEGQAERIGWKKAAWDQELSVVERMLDADSRNFHAWDYRRYVLANTPTPRPLKQELSYTMRKIESNFSNFSAWHQRSKVLSILWQEGKLKPEYKNGEFGLVRNAMYTDPNDQSVWMYHRWLIGQGGDKDILDQEIQAIQELLEEQPDSKWCMESIVHYKRLLMEKHSCESERVQLAEDCLKILKQLEKVDPPRLNRYREIAEETRKMV